MPAPATAPTEASLIEVFSSIQGEGLLVGCRQIFVRMALCNLSCAYCDTPFEPTDSCRIEDAPGSGNFRSLRNPVSLETLCTILHQWHLGSPGVHHSISLTGGEPLVQGALLRDWVPALKKILPVHLETNGTLPEALAPLVPELFSVAMDLKLPSQTGAPFPEREHREFLRLARRTHCQVKVVVGEETPHEEIAAAATLVHQGAPEVPLILQPVTRDGKITLTSRMLLDMQTLAAAIHPATRVIPQTHRFIGVL
ncbi:7-carboxy-7-deazaguanine synthase [Desulfuromonas versatilis]|uniref:7-carboxy-7-deazaguanine synthase n=1 Tax=Desulfuromonas versatilis TaxID=2802975 RepID=A0ABM8HWM9_9BACT|nr:7-carboxy-7-deazaguanine synthase QueE [Desulfuromonas versatilis]BCR04978.1 7-carboxy-7-deazaguanine synthase [Desulfuromonas versatilis]